MPQTIALLTPYGRTETTAAAVRLADLAVSLGYRTRLVACGVRETGVDPRWDAAVRTGVAAGVRGADVVVHFQANPAWVREAEAAATPLGVRHVLVPDWHGGGRRIAAVADSYDMIVCPSAACAAAVRRVVFDGNRVASAGRLAAVRWDAGVPPVRRGPRPAGGVVRVCVVCDAPTVDRCPALVLELAGVLLSSNPALRVTLLALKSWPRSARAAIAAARGLWPGRFVARAVPGHAAMTAEYLSHDWALVPGVRADFGFAAAHAMACGTPVVANDVPPYSEIVCHGTGVLVPCATASAGIAAVAEPTVGGWAEACRAAFATARGRDWGLEERAAAFAAAWRTILAG